MSETNSDCTICARIEAHRRNGAYLIHEFEHSLFVVGDHQYFPGYCLLLLKNHVRELHELPPETQAALFQEMMTATNAIVAAYQPYKMNHACLGNVDPHVHWHLIPRYRDEADFRAQPWLHADEFDQHKTTEETAKKVTARLRGNL